jgi:release factor glutamine methyltransferase
LHEFFIRVHRAKFAQVKQTADDLFQNCLTQLAGTYPITELKSVVRILLEDLFGISRMDMVLKKEVNVDAHALKEALERLRHHEPVQYVVGKALFLDREFRVAPGVLIPRPETEELVQWILEEKEQPNPVIWDIGTGSGCIAVSLALALPGAKVFGTDFSESALQIAQANADALHADVTFIHSDILLEAPALPAPYIIVSNPPYIPAGERTTMHANVTKHEPESALFVPDADPLLFYRRIAEVAKDALAPYGRLYFEIHEKRGAEVKQLLEQLGYQNVEIKRDMQGKDRMVRGVRMI